MREVSYIPRHRQSTITIDCFLPLSREQVYFNIAALKNEGEVASVTGLKSPFCRTGTLRLIAGKASAPYTLLYLAAGKLSFRKHSLQRLLDIAECSGAAMIYSDYIRESLQGKSFVSLLDYQEGSLRENFEFGPVLLFRTDAFKKAVSGMDRSLTHAALYDLRLRVSRLGKVEHVGEFLYEVDGSPSPVKKGSFLLPARRLLSYFTHVPLRMQKEYESALTGHLKAVGGYLEAGGKEVSFDVDGFPVEASVVIPCKNRVTTIGDAIRSVLSQETGYSFNVIVVDDHSSDGTVEVIRSFQGDDRVIYVPQGDGFHTIGDNLNTAIHHPKCGKFVIQLDSDDIYCRRDVIRMMVDTFYKKKCAMVVGSYRLADENLQPRRFGRVDHREWTEENGLNNALRMHGFGAPRGFYAPILRENGYPDSSYGEDYSVCLRISREYAVGRIYKVMSFHRRWHDNTDADLSMERKNSNDLYKDKIRTWELQARMGLNKKG